MIVPSRAMLWLWVAIGLPVCTAGILGALGFLWWLPLAVLATLAVWDAWRGSEVLHQIPISSEESVSLIRGRSSSLSFRILNRADRNVSVRFAPDFPVALAPQEKMMPATVMAPQSETVWSVQLQGTERGDWPVDGCFVEAKSPLGLWMVRGKAALSLLVRVYPDLSANKTAVVLLRHQSSGLKSYRQVGQGREFEKLREYSPGDTYDQIYWKASAKRARPMTKVFQVERAQPCYVLIDCSRQSGKSLDYFVEAALVLGLAAERFGDQFGVLTFSDRVHAFERARSGKKQFGRCRNALYALKAQPVSAEFVEMSRFVQTNLRKRSLLFILTSLEDPYAAEMLATHVKLLASRHAVVIGALRQERAHPVFDGPPAASVGDVYSALAGHLSWTKLRETAGRMESLGAQLVLCDRETIYQDLTNRYRQIRQRQIL